MDLVFNLPLMVSGGYFLVYIIIWIVFSICNSLKPRKAFTYEGTGGVSPATPHHEGPNKAPEEDMTTLYPTDSIEIHSTNDEFIMNQTYYNNQSRWKYKCRVYMELLLYVMTQSAYFGAVFVYISYSTSHFDLYFILFALAVCHMIFFKCFSSLSILMMTRNWKYFLMQVFDLLIVSQCFWDLGVVHNGKDTRKRLWIQQYLQTFASLFASLPQLFIGIVFILNQSNNVNVSTIIVWSSTCVSLSSLVAFNACNRKMDLQYNCGFYVCRFLEITSRIALMILLWIYCGTLYLSLILLIEFLYLLVCAVCSHNILLLGNMVYVIVDVYGRKKSAVFVGYRLLSTYVCFALIAWLMVTQSMNAQYTLPTIPFLSRLYSIFEVTDYTSSVEKFTITPNLRLYLFMYCVCATVVCHILLFRKYKTYIQSIGIGWDFQQLLRQKCWLQMHELMALGVRYKRFSQYDETNILCHVCNESETKAIHIDIARLYLSRHEETFSFDAFCLPFYYAIRTSSISMISLFMSHGANIEYLFENDDWCNALQCIINSPQPCMDKIEFILKVLQRKYGQEKEKISAFLNYQNGANYETPLLTLYRTNDYEMMEKGFDRLDAMQYLISNGANINIVDGNKWNVLHYAIQNRDWRVCRMLVRYGADVYCQSGDGQIPVAMACGTGCDELDIIKQLVDDAQGNEMINTQDHFGRTAMHYAACYASFDVLKYLMDRNGDCSIRDIDGLTALHFAIRGRAENTLQIDIAILLVVSGKSNVNSTDFLVKCSILHDAAKYQSVDIIEYLVQSGADIHSADGDGYSVEHYSLDRENASKYKRYWKELYSANEDEELSLSNINHLEAFQTIICDEATNDVDIINR